jgi:hypothetical protein
VREDGEAEVVDDGGGLGLVLAPPHEVVGVLHDRERVQAVAVGDRERLAQAGG